jgi:hypothetical protein
LRAFAPGNAHIAPFSSLPCVRHQRRTSRDFIIAFSGVSSRMQVFGKDQAKFHRDLGVLMKNTMTGLRKRTGKK